MRFHERRHPFFSKAQHEIKQLLAFSSWIQSSRGPPIQSKLAKNFFLGQAIGASRSIESRGCDAISRQLTKPSQRKIARQHPETRRAAVRFQLAVPSQSKEKGMRTEFATTARSLQARQFLASAAGRREKSGAWQKSMASRAMSPYKC